MKKEVIQGKLKGNPRGYAFLLPLDTTKQDYFIPHSDLKGGMHGDIVLAETTEGVGERTTARVLKIIERGILELVGTFFTCRSGGFVVPDDKCYFTDIFIPTGKTLRAKSGDKVVCKILLYPKKKNPEGLITKILGRQFDKKTELKSILFNYKLPERFPKTVLQEAEGLSLNLSSKTMQNRKDLSGELCFTIDGEDARDFDDAISIKKQGNIYHLGVHIADVSEYVKAGSPIDCEAFNRGTSVYFPEQVIPMLPEKLCNDLCSLVENQKRLTLSCIMKIDNNGEVIDSEIIPTLIKSSKRFTYTEVQKILDDDKQEISKHKALIESVALANELADVLIAKRERKGNIDLDIKESAIIVNNGEISVTKAPRDKAHRIIEEFMILANCTVAEYFYFLDIPFIYRVHEKPTEEKVNAFYEFLSGLGISVKRKKDEIFSKDFQAILKANENSPYYFLINSVMLRAMQKAKYSVEELGHFGLSEKFYSHFTSPIRRYPDLAIHRIIKDFISKGQQFVQKKYGDFVKEASIKSSEQERIAQEAERAVDDYYKILYISGFVGEEFDAIISGVTNFGLFAEIECGVEGLIKIETLEGSRYDFDAKHFTLSNKSHKYKLGQKVRIKVAGVDYTSKKAEYLLI